MIILGRISINLVASLLQGLIGLALIPLVTLILGPRLRGLWASEYGGGPCRQRMRDWIGVYTLWSLPFAGRISAGSSSIHSFGNGFDDGPAGYGWALVCLVNFNALYPAPF